MVWLGWMSDISQLTNRGGGGERGSGVISSPYHYTTWLRERGCVPSPWENAGTATGVVRIGGGGGLVPVWTSVPSGPTTAFRLVVIRIVPPLLEAASSGASSTLVRLWLIRSWWPPFLPRLLFIMVVVPSSWRLKWDKNRLRPKRGKLTGSVADRLRILLSSGKNSNTVLWLLYDFLLFILEKWCKCSFKKQKKLEKDFFVAIFKITDENSRIWIRIRIR